MLAILPAGAQVQDKADVPPMKKSIDPGLEASTIGWAYMLNDAHSFVMHYTSCDGKNNKVRLSARVYYPYNDNFDNGKEIKHIVLSCHPTTTDNRTTPTGPEHEEGAISKMSGIDGGTCMVVCPDYCGYGVSSHLQHPYLINDITARNCVDAVVAAIEEAKNRKWKFADDYKTAIVGYSQGGATALACTKYLESKACPDEIKNKVKLFETTCGDGPYSAVATVKQYLKWGKPKRDDLTPAENEKNPDMDLEYSCVLPLIVAAAKDAYGDGCMRTVNVEDYFEKTFLDSDVLNLIKTKGNSTDVLATAINRVMGRQRPVDVFSSNIIDKTTGEFNTSSNEYKCLMRALELGDLTKGWTPTHPITFYHLKNDHTVPYANLEAILAEGGIGKNSNVKVVTPEEAHSTACATEDGPIDILFDFFLNPGAILIHHSANLKGIGAMVFGKISQNPNFDKMTHAQAGSYFYLDYMFGTSLRDYYRLWE